MKRKTLPWLTLAVATCALVVWFVPAASGALAFDRDAVAGGEWWRLFTGHLAHWTADHLTWDLAAFAVLGALVERRSRAVFLTTVGLSAVAISIVVWTVLPNLATYRGLSGIDSALFAAASATMLRAGISERCVVEIALPTLALLGLVAKCAFEIHTGATLFVTANGAFVPVPLAHLAGLVVGLVAGLLPVGCAAAPRARSDRSFPSNINERGVSSCSTHY
jgi:rhomboid family GlyGly-CTERM serine protease